MFEAVSCAHWALFPTYVNIVASLHGFSNYGRFEYYFIRIDVCWPIVIIMATHAQQQLCSHNIFFY